MKLDLTDLERLATILETKARTAEAKAHEHAQAKEFAESDKETKRAKSGIHFSQVCREAHRLLSTRQKRAQFTPPSWEEVLEYTKARNPLWPVADVLAWFNYFESNGWMVGGKTRMVNWKRAADNGFGRWAQKNPQATRKPQVDPRTGPDPAGWREFLKSLARPYKPYRFEMEHVRSEFQKSRR